MAVAHGRVRVGGGGATRGLELAEEAVVVAVGVAGKVRGGGHNGSCRPVNPL